LIPTYPDGKDFIDQVVQLIDPAFAASPR
jgi:hypothetical protein